MPDADTIAHAESLVRDTIQTLLQRRGAANVEITAESNLTADLGLDSLELAEISAVLEDEFGRDPYSDGLVPETVGAIIDYYR